MEHSWETLLDRQAKLPDALYSGRLSYRSFRDFIDEKLLNTGTQRGNRRGKNPDWKWTCRDYLRLLRIRRLQRQGVTSRDEICMELWLRGGEIPIDRVRKAARHLFPLIKRQMMQPFRDDTGNYDLSKAGQRKALKRRLGEASPTILPSGFEYQLGQLDRITTALRFGENVEKTKADLGKILYDMGIGDIASAVSMGSREFASFIANQFTALFGAFGELANQIEHTIINASEEQYLAARQDILLFRDQANLSLLSHNIGVGGLSDSVRAVSRLPIMPWGFVTFLNSLQARFRQDPDRQLKS